MDDTNAGQNSAQALVIGRKSWLAYFGVAVLAAILLGGALPLAFLWNETAAIVVLVASGALLFYRIAQLRSVQLYVDDAGVWVHSGVLPWKKGVTGVKWRDVDEATYAQGFWSWITRSYMVRIGHRFTKSNEIVLSHIGGGKQAVATINARHQALVRAGLDD
ncbi:MAG: hypothetical protein M3Y65_25645 [Pseudomonadota bacterium]|nr:hypothetical protein [Pseudomonadota bacterium]